MNRLFGYADPLAIKAGETVSFKLSAAHPVQADVQLVRLVHGDTNPEGPGFVEEPIDTVIPAVVDVVPQPVHSGSYARAAAAVPLSGRNAGTLCAFIQPTIWNGREQAIAGCWSAENGAGYLLLIDQQGCLRLRIGGGGGEIAELTLSRPLATRCWYFVAARWDAANNLMSLEQISRINRWNSQIGQVGPFDLDDAASSDAPFAFVPATECDFTIAAGSVVGGSPRQLFNGKIDRPRLYGAALDDDAIVALADGMDPASDQVIAFWDTTAGYTEKGIGDLIVDVGPSGFDAQGVNRPIRAMTGWNWTGRDDSFRLAPSQYGGVAFHEDALIDCEWASSVTWQVPVDLPSGAYALRLRAVGCEDHVPFFVRPAQPKAAIAVLMPTFTYLAYANEHLAFEAPIAQAICANTPVVSPDDLHWKAEAEFGLSTYDVHSDYAGVCYSSWRRPILNMRPRYRMPATGVPWAFPADLSLLWWLEHAGFEYEILTDHDLDREGLSALEPYRTVLTGTHPEYYSEAMLDAKEDYLRGGGRVCYLGGNGYYWVTSVRPEEPWCIEVRKLDSGSRAWQAMPGEHYLATTGERSGLWRARGRAPQKMVGVGFTTEGMDESRPFERLADSHDSQASWIFDGVGPTELIGDFGLGLGGASGIEMDRYDLALGTPPHALLLAASFGHSDNYPLVSEEVSYAFPGRGGTQDPQVRGDIVYFTTANGGAVFAAGSIAWSQALPCKGGENNVARIMTNVLRAFSASGPLPG